MNFIEAMKSQRAIRRPGRVAHVGSHGNGWVDPYMFLSCCSNVSRLGMECPLQGLHLTMEDILAEDWEAFEEKKHLGGARTEDA